MSATLFKEINYSLSKLVEDIDMGEIGLPDLQRPFVWPNTKVRDLFDSMYRGYPVGYLLLWENGAAPGAGTIGLNRKQVVPRLLVIDGQQRLTSLYAVLRGVPVKRENFKEERISIAFRPTDGTFEVADAAILKDAAWIPDVSRVWAEDTDIFKLVEEYLSKLGGARAVEDADAKAIKQAIQRLSNLTSFPFTALQLAGHLDEEQVAEVFVRINSKGTPLNQADFILTLMSVFRDELRTGLEDFCRETRVPSTAGPSPFNYFIEPDPDHLLRVGVGLGFRRARLQHVYSILRGKDLETGTFSEVRRDEQFAKLEQALAYTLDLTNWHEFLKSVMLAGFRGAAMLTSRNALLYAYVYFLIGRRDYGVDLFTLRSAIARWFFFVALTGRYTTSPETRMEQDLADLREVATGNQFVAHLDRTIAAGLTNDYWQVTLPSDLATSSARSPELYAYYAALNLLDARALFSKLKVAELLDPATKAKKAAVERHHLFPKAYLRRQGIRSRREVNQIANYALMEWPDNIKVSDQAPEDYVPELASRFKSDALEQMCEWHALPDAWETLEYPAFLEARRGMIASVIRKGFDTLQSRPVQEELRPAAREAASDTFVPAAAVAVEHLLARVPPGCAEVLEDLLEEEPVPVEALEDQVKTRLAYLETQARFEPGLDLERARKVASRCLDLLRQLDGDTPDAARRLTVLAAEYFLLEDDAKTDLEHHGFTDDEAVVSVVESAMGSPWIAEAAAGGPR